MPRTRSSLNKYSSELAMIEWIADELLEISLCEELTDELIRKRSQLLIEFGEYNTRLGPGVLPWLGFVKPLALSESIRRIANVVGAVLLVAFVFGLVSWIVHDVVRLYVSFIRLGML